MSDRPYTLLSCGMSLDGYLDSATDERLLLSNDADFDRVDDVRAGCDAILVGAATVRRDNPRLLVRAAHRREERLAAGRPSSPMKVTMTRKACLDPSSNFFATGDSTKLVYCPAETVDQARQRLGSVATVVDGGPTVHMRGVSEDLHERGVRRLMVEGGGTVHTQFLTEGLADELQLVVAPVFVGDGQFPWGPDHRATLAETRTLGDVVLLRYALSGRFED